ncbi:hypothetical protein [Bartonella quintana]|uniref:hypothetical protein n=1 Tax=Bartonella quintana TaxID=803 RepID=UPI00027FCD99|nr:hypothetical protein [Bartonella quintana]AFR26767.1 hypothetical protein RM11_1069 [Bartonella quintana RM-11]
MKKEALCFHPRTEQILRISSTFILHFSYKPFQGALQSKYCKEVQKNEMIKYACLLIFCCLSAKVGAAEVGVAGKGSHAYRKTPAILR